MPNYEQGPLLGLCPIGKFVFSHEDAVRQKKLIQAKLTEWGVRFVDLDDVLEDGMVRDQKHVASSVEHFKTAGVDCLFLPHCNFGTEGTAAMIARDLGVPTLLWGPRDEAPLADGTRLRDSLCGMFATSKVLGKLGVTFTYIENCRIDDPQLLEGVDTFLRAINVSNLLRRGCKIGHIGQRIDFFWTTIINESELLQRFNVEILPIDMVEFLDAVKNRAASGRSGYEAEVKKLRSEAIVEGFDDDQPLINVLAVRDQMLAAVDDNALDALAIQSFMSIVNAAEAYTTHATGLVAERCPIGMESDIHGALSDLLLRKASLDAEPAYLADLTVRHPTNDNAVLMWHGGAAPSLMHPEAKLRIGKHWILPSNLSGMTHFRLKDGPVTITRFDGDDGKYLLAVGEGKTVDGPDTLNNWTWMEVDDWPKWERTLMEGPFIHHAAMAYGHYGKALIEATRYIPGLEAVQLGRGKQP